MARRAKFTLAKASAISKKGIAKAAKYKKPKKASISGLPKSPLQLAKRYKKRG